MSFPTPIGNPVFSHPLKSIHQLVVGAGLSCTFLIAISNHCEGFLPPVGGQVSNHSQGFNFRLDFIAIRQLADQSDNMFLFGVADSVGFTHELQGQLPVIDLCLRQLVTS